MHGTRLESARRIDVRLQELLGEWGMCWEGTTCITSVSRRVCRWSCDESCCTLWPLLVNCAQRTRTGEPNS